jgi:hypothetical protein
MTAGKDTFIRALLTNVAVDIDEAAALIEERQFEAALALLHRASPPVHRYLAYSLLNGRSR